MDYPATIGAGLIGGGVKTAVLHMGMAEMPKQMKMNLLYLLGSMTLPQRALAYRMGAMMHPGMSVAFALANVGIYQALEIDTNLAHVCLAKAEGVYLALLWTHSCAHSRSEAGRQQCRQEDGFSGCS